MIKRQHPQYCLLDLCLIRPASSSPWQSFDLQASLCPQHQKPFTLGQSGSTIRVQKNIVRRERTEVEAPIFLRCCAMCASSDPPNMLGSAKRARNSYIQQNCVEKMQRIPQSYPKGPSTQQSYTYQKPVL